VAVVVRVGVPGGGGGGCGTGTGSGDDHEERKIISTTCRDECPAGSSVSAGTGPRGPGGGDGGTVVAGFGLAVFFFAGSGLGFEPGLGLGLGFGLLVGLDETTWLRVSPELPQPARGRSGWWGFLGAVVVATLAATSSAAMDLQWRDRTQLPAAAVGRRWNGGGFSGMRRPGGRPEMQRSLWLTPDGCAVLACWLV
jgi:hypothetical protein